MKRAFVVIALVLLVDQALKIWVKLSFHLDEFIPHRPDSWYYLHFIENEGMAFGLKFGGDNGKLFLTAFRIAAVGVIYWLLRGMVRHGAGRWVITGMSLILAGALGNIIDSTLYGVLFSESTQFQKAVLFPPEGGYAPLFHGAVVDMFYFPLLEGRFPDWMPLWAGEHFIFFRPVFNVADATITTGVVLLVLARRKPKPDPEMSPMPDTPSETDGGESTGHAPRPIVAAGPMPPSAETR